MKEDIEQHLLDLNKLRARLDTLDGVQQFIDQAVHLTAEATNHRNALVYRNVRRKEFVRDEYFPTN